MTPSADRILYHTDTGPSVLLDLDLVAFPLDDGRTGYTVTAYAVSIDDDDPTSSHDVMDNELVLLGHEAVMARIQAQMEREDAEPDYY